MKTMKTNKFNPVWGKAEGLDTDSIMESGEGEIIKAIEGKIVAVYDPTEREGKFGPYSVQDIKVETDSGEIACTLWNIVVGKNEKGKRFTATCQKGKGGLGGIEYKIESWDDKKTGETRYKECLHIRDKARFEIHGANGEQPKQSSQRPEKQEAHREHPISFEKAVISLLNKHAIVDQAVAEFYKDHSPETRQAYVATIWIALDRLGYVSVDAPTIAQDARSEAETPAKGDDSGADQECDYSDPMDWGSFIVPLGKIKGKKLAELKLSEAVAVIDYAEERGYKDGFWAGVMQMKKDRGISSKKDAEEIADEIGF